MSSADGALVIDVLFKSNGAAQPIDVVLVGIGGPIIFSVPWPAQMIRRHDAWRRRYLAHHDPNGPAVAAAAVNNQGDALVQSLQEWFAGNAWRPFVQQRQLNSGSTPLRISFEGDNGQLQALPWEMLPWNHEIWRTEKLAHLVQRQPQTTHQPRLLILVGNAAGLDLSRELQQLKQLQRAGQITLEILQGPRQAGLQQLSKTLDAEVPWDGLIFLGHSDGNAAGGGNLQLANGSWVTAQQLQGCIQKAAERGLAFVLLNSCSGLDLAKSMIGFGVPWAVCFRDPVPCKAASQAFLQLIKQLKANNDLVASGAAVREALRANNETAGAGLLLTVLASSAHATPYTLPLTRRRQFQLRLKATTRKQWLAAAAAVILGGVFDVVPTNPASHYLLDRRLYLQKIWRQGIGKPGPTAAAIPVVVIDQNTFQKVGAKKVPKRVSRQTLAKLLQATPPVQVPKVAIDVVLDENAPHIEELAEVIKNQQRRLVFAGYFGPNVEAPSSGATSKPQQVLKDAGLKAFNLSIGTIASGSELQEAPLRLAEAITSANFSAQLSDQPSRVMPAEAVLDWSLDWQSMIHRVEPDQLSTLNAPVLLIGSDGTLDPEKRDEFKRPGALNPNLSSLWKGSRNKVPGVIVQAVLAQSLNLKHWLTPMSSAIAAGLTAALAVALSALVDKRRKRLAICVGIAVVAIPLCMQIAISSTWLLPLVLPLGALIVISFMRED